MAKWKWYEGNVLDSFDKKGKGGGFFWNGGNKEDNNMTSYNYQPYSGPAPEAPNYLRPSEDMAWNTISRRSQGTDVGYDPSRRAAQEALIRSQSDRARADSLRSARGSVSSAGLSGNARAREAIEGRVNQDADRSLNDAMTQITIEDLARANQERDTNTERLQRFNEFQFGQSNKVADWNLSKYLAEQGLQQKQGQFDASLALSQQSQSDQNLNDILGLGIGAASLAMGNPAPIVMYGANQMASNGGGYGVAPTAGQSASAALTQGVDPWGSYKNSTAAPSRNKYLAYRNLVK